MSTNEIKTNEELIETAEEMITANSGTGLNKVVGIGLGLLICGLTYKCAIKPIISKIKSKKKEEITNVVDESEIVDIDEYHEELEENE